MRVLLIISIAVISFQSTYGQKQAGSFFRLLQFYNERDELQYFPLPSMILVNQRTNCFFTYPVSDTLGSFRTRLNPGAAVGKKTFLTIHGNVLYDLNYNSRIDTPYFQNDVYQHTVQTYLSVTIREKYPVRVAFTVSFGNSNVFSNFSNLNLQFDRFDFTKGIKQKLYKAIPVVNSDSLTNLQKIIDEKAKVLSVLTNGKRNPAYLQKQVEALERDLYLKKVAGDSVAVSARPKDSTLLFAADKEYREKRLIDSLRIELQELQGKYRALRSKAQLSASNIKDRIEKATTAKELKQLADETGLGDTILPKGYRFLTNIRSLGLGRCFINYSELSAKNVSIKGMNLEYNPGYYFAIAGGVVDYRYRDFVLRGSGDDQYLALARVGKGFKEGNHFYVTYYTGRKRFYNSFTSSAATEPNFTLMGITVELQQKLAKHTFLTGEIAKSSAPYYHQSSGDKSNLKSIFSFNDGSNQAYSLSFRSLVEATGTRVNASYRSTGENFQSFSLFNTGTKQISWSFRVDQPLFRQQLLLSSSIRANDFSNPFILQQFSSRAIFKTFQATLRVKRLPVISLGYFPSSQISKINETTYLENIFHTFNASVFHYYRTGKCLLNTGIVFTQFYNKASDSNFIYFNTKNLMMAHSMNIGKWMINVNGMYSSNSDYSLRTLEGRSQYAIKSWLRIGGGFKYNTTSERGVLKVGYNGSAAISIPTFGEIQFLYDKGFIPGVSKNLVDHTIGRLTYSKTF